MDSQGQRGQNNPKAMLTSILGKRQKLQEELRSIEKQVYELETSYLQESSNFGNIWRGFEGFLSSTKNTTNMKRSKKFQLEDRLFSLSSVTSPAQRWKWLGASGREKDGGRVRGKPKRGRTGPRDGKKFRISSDLDPDDEDDPDMGMR
ncbi:hypothetical protein DCAR_0832224 [Daucus carota subsp. sativus]|uniref:Chromatin modification-related protein MEAF6 n=1 Tax=Daucus carota subsp. sativus TaxID=79200 RepID=A0AAF0XR50_DAUCS|nr:hypothetical protein DCAR_0832224 [Daucus carota subsp. sativus]